MNRLISRAAAAALLCSTPALADIVHVDAGLTTGANDGSSWENAFRGPLGLQAALGAATAGDDIWVAAGTYRPASGAPRTASFVMRSGIEIFGGFAGGETDVAQRDPSLNVVILSADLAGDDASGGSNAENAYHVVSGGTATGSALLSGVTITGGNANGGGANIDRGGGLLLVNGVSPRFEDCIVIGNRCVFGGGAGYIANSSPDFTRVRFEDNVGGSFGGAFDIFSSGTATSVEFTACRFEGNRAARAGGVEVFGGAAVATLVNCVLLHNDATGEGGAMYVANGATALLLNTTVVGNATTGNTGGIHLAGVTASIRNSIVWSNTDSDGNASQISGSADVRYSNVEGGWSGGGGDNIDAPPLFVDRLGGNVDLKPGSPGIDGGNNALVPGGVTTDLDGGPRYVDDPCAVDGGAGTPPIVDMGALERDPTTADCDESGVADECEIADGLLADCDGNGVPDVCDIAAGADDCNGNGIPDVCEVSLPIAADSGVLTPFDSAAPQALSLSNAPPAGGDVVIDLTASGDLDAMFELAAVEVNGTNLGAAFQAGAGLCAVPPDMQTIIVSAATWNDATAGGAGALITVTPNGLVGPGECPDSFIRIEVSYASFGSNDVDGDGVPDDCTACPYDLDDNGDVGLVDLLILLSVWGPCPDCPADLNDDGIVGIGDLIALLSEWGPCA